MSVCGTGTKRICLAGFLGSMVTLTVGRPRGGGRTVRVGSGAYFTIPLDAYALQRAVPSARGGVTSRSHVILQSEYRNINRFVIRFASRLLLRSRLTLIRLTLFRKPGVFGVRISILIIVTYAYIFFSSRSSRTHVPPSTLTGMLPYHACLARVLSFGDSFYARSSSTHHRSTSELLRTL